MSKRKSSDLGPEKPKKLVDELSEKHRRGRPRQVRYETVWGRAENYRYSLSQVWHQLCGPLLASKSEQETIEAFEKHAQPYAQEFVPRLASDIFELIRNAKFPERPKAQINCLADSLPGRPTISMRRSRDICGKMRAEERAKSPHKIIRKEFYVECSCGYKGPAKYDACRKCGAQISWLSEILVGSQSP